MSATVESDIVAPPFAFDSGTLESLRSNPAMLDELMEYMTPHEKREVHALLAGVLWLPNPGVQTEAYFSPAWELLYGGKPGGGKSSLLIGLALTAHHKSIIFRRELNQNQDLIEESRQIIGGYGRYNGSYHIWRGLPGGRSLEFGGVKSLEDAERKYKGRPHDLKAFDEIPDFGFLQYKFLTGWNRSSIPGQHTRIVCTGNPPNTPEGAWVIDYWSAWLRPDNHPKPALPCELRYYAVIDGEEVELESEKPFDYGGELIVPKSRTFIPASIDDNPFLKDTDYKSVIQSLPEPLRSRLLTGDYTIGWDDDPWQIFPTEWIKLAQKRWREQRVPQVHLTSIGIDAAYGGTNDCVLAPRFGNFFGTYKQVPGKRIERGSDAALLLRDMLELYPEGEKVDVLVDVIGYGSTTFEACEELVRPKYSGYEGSLGNRRVRSQHRRERLVKVHPVNVGVGSSAVDKTGKLKMRNLKAEIAWKFREELDPATGSNICLPDTPQVLADLTSYRWRLTLGGVILEEKADQKERIGRSPDVGEAILLASYQSFRPKQEKASGALARALRHRGI